VGDEVRAQFLAADAPQRRDSPPMRADAACDLALLASSVWPSSGVSRVSAVERCTYADARTATLSP